MKKTKFSTFLDRQRALAGDKEMAYISPTGMIAVVGYGGNIFFNEKVIYGEMDVERNFPEVIKKSFSAFILEEAGFELLGEV